MSVISQGLRSAGVGMVWVSELSVCSHYTDYTALPPDQEQGHAASRGEHLVATLTLSHYTILYQ